MPPILDSAKSGAEVPPFLEISEVEHIYGGNRNAPLVALQGLSFSVSAHEVIAIVGLSGCGKTTLLRLTAGLIEPSRGQICIANRTPTEFLRSRKLGFVFQNPLLFPWRTLKSNLLLASEVGSGLSSGDASNKADDLLKLLGLESFANLYPRQLSGGMLQRAALARALMLDPSLLLLDEPFGALDELTREQLWTDFSAIWHRNRVTVILVTHSIREAVFLADRTLVMTGRPGRIAAETSIPFAHPRSHEIATRPEFTELCEDVRRDLVK